MNRMRIALAGLVALAAAVLMPALAPAQSEFTESQREDIGRIVRDYLLANPELMEEVFEVLERRHAEARESARAELLAENREVILRSPRVHVAGNPDGDVTLVEFFDYNCGHCRRMRATISELIDTDPGLRVVLREWPVLGQESVDAARIAVAVLREAPESYFNFHLAMMAHSGPVDGDAALAIAGDLGLDEDIMALGASDPAVDAALGESMRMGDMLELRATPAYLVGDEVIIGGQHIDRLREAIDRTRRSDCENC